MTDTLLNLASPEKLFIGGDWSPSSGSDGIEIISPATEEKVQRRAMPSTTAPGPA